MKTSQRKWLPFSAIAIGLFSAVLDGSMIGIALPQISKDFSLDISKAAWVSLVSTITVVAILLPAGNMSDRIGRKRLYLFGVVIMAVGSLLCSLSQNFIFLLFLRIIVSIGAAMRMSTGLAMVMMIFGDKERGTGLGANTTTVGLAAISGPIFGGFLVSNFGWESVFLTQFILSVPVFVLAVYYLDPNIVDASRKKNSGNFDYAGSLISAIAFSVLLFSINFSIISMSLLLIIGSIFAVFILFSLFIYVESKADTPILDTILLKNPRFIFSMGTRLFGFLAGSSTLFLMPFYIQMVKGIPADQAGLLIFPGAVGMAITASVSGRLSDKFGEKRFILLGLIIVFLAGIMFSQLSKDSSNLLLISILVFHGLGMGIWASPNGSQTVSLVPKYMYGSVSALINLVRTIAMGTSIAIASSVITLSFINLNLNPDFSSTDYYDSNQILAFMDGFRNTYFTLLGINFISIIFALLSKSKD